jgi:hypothetical protein
MKTILGFSSAALAGATTQSIAATANSGHTAMLKLRFTICILSFGSCGAQVRIDRRESWFYFPAATTAILPK